jgi:hypothetical protein
MRDHELGEHVTPEQGVDLCVHSLRQFVGGDSHFTLEPERLPCDLKPVPIADAEWRTGILQNSLAIDQGNGIVVEEVKLMFFSLERPAVMSAGTLPDLSLEVARHDKE